VRKFAPKLEKSTQNEADKDIIHAVDDSSVDGLMPLRK
jgi:hypothetical protein